MSKRSFPPQEKLSTSCVIQKRAGIPSPLLSSALLSSALLPSAPLLSFSPLLSSSFLSFTLSVFFFFETDSHYVAQAGLQLMILRSHLPTAGITGVHYHTWFSYIFSFLIILPKEVPCLHPHLLPLVHSIFC
jgi:hypothetical protein